MKLKMFLRVGILVGLVFPMVAGAAYNSVSLTTGTTLRTTVGGSTIDLTVVSGTIQSVTVNSGSIDLTLAAGSSIDLTSASKLTFNYNVNSIRASFSCNSSTSVLSLSVPAGGGTETTTITPINTTCVSASTSSGGGGSSSSSSSSSTTSTTSSTSSASPTITTTTTAAAPATPTKTTTTTTAKPAAPAITAPVVTMPVVQPTRVVVSPLTSEINPGARNDEVMKLQELLAQDPTIYPDGTVSGYYGPKTTAAVKKFQAKYGLPTVGRVGPATLAKLNDIFGPKAEVVSALAPSVSVQAKTADQIQSQIQAIQQQIQAITSGSAVQVAPAVSGSVSIDSELNPGTRSDEVMDLQKLLAQDPEVYPDGTVSGFYGPKTTAAVKKFQAKYGLPTVGRVGPATMQKINEVLGGSSSIESAPMVPQTSSYTPVTPTPVSSSDTAKQIEDQIKAIQAQIDALLKK